MVALGRALPKEEWKGQCAKLFNKRERINGVRFDKDDVVVNVQWCDKTSVDNNLHFRVSEDHFFPVANNAATLLMVGVKPTQIEGATRRTSGCWRPSANNSSKEERWCREEFSRKWELSQTDYDEAC